MSGRRIKLNLSDFVSDAGCKRWMYLSEGAVSTVSDLVDILRSEYTQIGENDLVTLLLDNYILPHWESIDILQSGDLVTVIRNKTNQSTVQSGTPRIEKKEKATKNKLTRQAAVGENQIKTGQKRSRESSSSSDSSSDDDSSKPMKKQQSAKATKVNDSPKIVKKQVISKQGAVAMRTTAVSSSSSSESSSSDSSEEEVNKVKISATKNTLSKANSSSSESTSSDSEAEKTNSKPQSKVIAVNHSKTSPKSDSDSSSSSDSEIEPVKENVTKPPVKKVGTSSDSSSSNNSDAKVTNKVIDNGNRNQKQVTNSAHEKPKRKRKRKNKNKNKLPPDQLPVFETEISSTIDNSELSKHSKPFTNSRKVNDLNSHKRFNEENECTDKNDKMEVDESPSTFTGDEIKKLYAQSVSVTSKQFVGNGAHERTDQRKQPISNKKVSNLSCEDVLLSQFEEKKVNNHGIVKKPMFKPRVLSVQEMKVNVVRKQPLVFSQSESSKPRIQPDLSSSSKSLVSSQLDSKENGEQKEVQEEKDVISSQFEQPKLNEKTSEVLEEPVEKSVSTQLSALFNCKGQVFDRNSVTKDYSAYHLVSDSGPRVGDIIAFKHVEMGENYTPEVSDYKEGKVIECDGTNWVTFEMLTQTKVKKNGKFEIDDDQTDLSDKVQTFNWSDLLEPRLVFP